jgi:DNA-binding MarR family transcriptional regulator
MESIMKYINRISRCNALYRNGQPDLPGLNGCQHSYILNICRYPGISQDRLAHILCIHKSNVTRQLSLLEQNGFITRSPDAKDKRAMQVYPTDKALDIYPKIKSLSAEWNEYLCSGLSESELNVLFPMLKKILDRAVEKTETEIEKEPEI